MVPNQLSHPKYRPDIDGLRAIAVLSVVCFHAFPGYLSFGEFYRRRVKRIFPALLLVLFAVLVCGWFLLFSDAYLQQANCNHEGCLVYVGDKMKGLTSWDYGHLTPPASEYFAKAVLVDKIVGSHQ